MNYVRVAMLFLLSAAIWLLAPPVWATESVPPDVGNYDYGFIRCDTWHDGYPSRAEDERVGAKYYYDVGCGAEVTEPGAWATLETPQGGACGGYNITPSYFLGVETYNKANDSVTYKTGATCSSSSIDGMTIRRSRSVDCPPGYTPNDQTNLCDPPPPALLNPTKNNGTCNAGCNGTDPINSATGALVVNEQDFSDPEHSLDFERTYTSSEGVFDETSLGTQWRNTFDRRISVVTSGAITAATSYRADGDRYHFLLSPSGTWVSDQDVAIKLSSATDVSGNIIGWTLIEADGTKESYNADGYLVRITPRSQNALVLSYDGIHLAKVSNAHGRSLLFTYGQIAYQNLTRLTEVDTPDGLRIQYGYDPATGMLTSASYVGSVNGQTVTQTRAYVYGKNGAPEHAMTGLVDEANNRYTSWAYDADGRANLSVHGPFTADAGRTELTYNADGSTSIVNWIDSAAGLSTTRQFVFDIVQGVAHLSGVSCGSCSSAGIQLPGIPTQPASVTFDVDGYPASTTDFNHNVTTSQYNDTYGLLTQKVEAEGTSSQRTTKFTWNNSLRVPLSRKVLDAQGQLVAFTSWTYNAFGELQAHCEADPTMAGAASYICTNLDTPPAGVRRRTYTYCTAVNTTNCPLKGLLLTTDGPRNDAVDVTSFAYYMLDGVNHHKGDLKSITDPLGHVTNYLVYDGAGRVTSIQGPNGAYTNFAYTPRGWLASRSLRSTPDNTPAGSDATTTLTYWPYGEVKTLTDPDSVTTSFGYDAAHRLVRVTDAQGNYILYTLNAAGDRTKERVFTASGTAMRSLSRQYNALGQVIAVIDGLSHTVFKAGYADSYDANGNLLHSVDALGYQRQLAFDPLDRLVKTIDNYTGIDPSTSNTKTQFTYDALDRLAMVVDPDNLSTSYTYDGLGNRTALQSPDTGTSTDSFDAAGNWLVHTDAKGVVTTSTYDALNRLLQVSAPADTTINTTYTYDEPDSSTGCVSSWPVGRLTTVANGSASTVFCYDANGNVTEKVETVEAPAPAPPWSPGSFGNNLIGGIGVRPATTEYLYTKAGRLSGVMSPDGTLVSYAYDSNGQIGNIQATPYGTSAASTVVNDVNRLPFGPVTGYTLGNGQRVTRTYDANYRLTDLTSPALTLHFANDVMGDITALGNAPGANPATESYAYDPLYRLSSVKDGTSTLERYTYDRTGDRLSKTAAGLATGAYSYTGGTHQLAGIGNAPQVNDATGNLTGSVIGGASYAFSYNALNQLLAAELSGTVVGTYTYNALGQRMRKVSASGGRTFAYDETDHLIGDYGAVSHAYVWLGDIPVAAVDYGSTTTISYITADQLGTPRVVSDGSSNTIWSWAYAGNPFGEQPPASAAGYGFNLRFPGQYYDAESGLVHNGFRDYCPACGRYIQSDPMGLFAHQSSTYAYAKNDPQVYSDSLGLDSVVLINNTTVMLGGGYAGHAAVLVGSDQSGWNYYSENGMVDGVQSTSDISYATLAEFEAAQGSTYLTQVGLLASAVQDADMNAWAKQHLSDAYSPLTNNCGDFVNHVLNAGHIKTFPNWFMPTIPNDMYDDLQQEPGAYHPLDPHFIKNYSPNNYKFPATSL